MQLHLKDEYFKTYQIYVHVYKPEMCYVLQLIFQLLLVGVHGCWLDAQISFPPSKTIYSILRVELFFYIFSHRFSFSLTSNIWFARMHLRTLGTDKRLSKNIKK